MGGSANTFSQGEPLPVGIKITGTLSKPSLKLDLSEATKTLSSEVASKATEKASEAVDKAIENIKDENPLVEDYGAFGTHRWQSSLCTLR